ncbi:MAG TPA: UDP-glucose 4-epimerase GalE [Deltaproteobacteria bacterium]|nr:UDP-glucose 4-epimerase GalE [Deltaproteobacteria bacterium]
MRIAITGGAGYIGSHAVHALLQRGHRIVVIDNLSTGHRQAVDPGAELWVTDLRDTATLRRALQGADAVMHFAARSIVPESVSDPLAYWDNNVGGSISLLSAMRDEGVGTLVFSSTAATYGVPDVLPIAEDTPQSPINPYGATKLAVESAIADVHRSDPAFCSTILRYFNVVGCSGGLGEDHHPETHLLPLVLQAAAGRRAGVAIFGTDYPTPDGTCLRDYVHVSDLVEAHLLALDALQPGDARIYNVGLGRGWSVREIVQTVKDVTGRDFEVREEARRPGDPPALITDPTALKTALGWAPRHPAIADAIASQWAWMREHPRGWSHA